MMIGPYYSWYGTVWCVVVVMRWPMRVRRNDASHRACWPDKEQTCILLKIQIQFIDYHCITISKTIFCFYSFYAMKTNLKSMMSLMM